MIKQKLTTLLILLLLLSACSNGTHNDSSSSTEDQLTQAIEDISHIINNVNQIHNEQQAESYSIDTNDTASETPSSPIAPSGNTVKEDALPSDTSSSHSSSPPSNISTVVTEPDEYDFVLVFPSERYPETALHIFGAIEQGYSDVCTIDRDGAEDNRKESLKGIPTVDGYDRDEWPMAMCEEGGKGASVAYISASDNRGAGSWVGNQLTQYKDGERILFIVEKPTHLFPVQDEEPDNVSENNITDANNVVYRSCAEAKEAGAAPIKVGEPGYSKKLDRDGDGIACET